MTSFKSFLKFLYFFQLTEKPKRSEVPLQGLAVFTDGSGHSQKSVVVWRDPSSSAWRDVCTAQGSPQFVELAAVVRAFQKFSVPLIWLQIQLNLQELR